MTVARVRQVTYRGGRATNLIVSARLAIGAPVFKDEAFC
jgi:hypothetical protein